MRATRFCAILMLVAANCPAREPAEWTVARSPHFSVYSDSSPETARALAAGLERLHAFFSRFIGLAPPAARELRVIAFASAREYTQFRTSPNADAFYLGAADRDYIVLPTPARGELRIPAHEYAHVLIHGTGWRLPEWLAEGISDVVSTVQLRDRGTLIGGDFPGRSAALKAARWIPLSELRLDDAPTLFYAESWAVADALMFSPSYSAGFPSLLGKLASGVPAAAAFAAVYGTTQAAVERDARARLSRPMAPTTLPAVGGAIEIRAESVTPFAAELVLADLRLANGDTAIAESLYRGMLRDHPAAAEVHAALGTIALVRGDTAAATESFARAIEFGIGDAALCFRYAALADLRGLPIRPALERAIALRPDFDDARFKLALLENNAGNPEAAVAQLRAMQEISPRRAYAWWSALGNALVDLNRRDEARHAATQARAHAATPAERDRAAQLDWMANSELAVQFDGQKVRTVRVPVGAAAHNPFVEPGDRAERIEATLREVQCNEASIALVVDSARGPLTLAVPDPTRVEIRNAGGATFEFTCGAQSARPVSVDYAASSLTLRGLTLR
ncbi:MAG: hypothetical protein JWP63_2062 [Candidatus Solibacter sp.]|nr:hypothetical protein [Candidatus Solibacter sp.]